MTSVRIFISFSFMLLFGAGQLIAQEDSVGYQTYIPTIKKLREALNARMYGGATAGFRTSNQSWGVRAGVSAEYYPKLSKEQALFYSIGGEATYDYTNEGSEGEFQQNFDGFNIGPSASVNWIFLPAVLLYGQLQLEGGIGKSTQINPFSQQRFVDNTTRLAAECNAGVSIFFDQANTQLDLKTNVANVVRWRRTNADNPDQRFSSTTASLGLNKSNTVQLSYRRRF
ncbi:MAG: hypothetical protein AAF206_12680 [Bacteroidota bacterium]